MRDLFTYFVFGSWWVALCAASMGLLTWFELTGNWWNTPLFIFILGSTLVIYNLNMLSGLKELREMGTHSERHHWCMEHETLMKITLGIGLLLSAISVLFLNPVIWLLMAPLGFVALAYAAPIVRRNAAKIRIREIGLWKIFIIAAVWAGMTAILPAVEQFGLEQLFEELSWRLAAERAIFTLAITIPFDVRDLINDAKKGIRTIPSTIGWKQSVILAEVLLVLFGILIYFRLGPESLLLLGYVLSILITAIVVGFASPNRSDMYCSFWVEGTMIVQFLAVLALWKF
ncbi:MAG: UbiA family prenyltransferase [Flavobacteriales bacterium]